jgi:phenylacetic acid degradation operon negative regulatory protein
MYYSFEPLAPSSVSPRALVLSLLSGTAAGPHTSIARLVSAAALFGIEAATLRVAVTRLLKDGLIESPDRGVYRPGPKAQGLTRRVQDWQNVRARLAPWKGDWLVALTHHLGRTDRKQLRARERALALSGYRAADAALWVRPANLARSTEDHRTDLTEIGADEAIMLLRVSETAMQVVQDWPSLWSPDDLAASYTAAISAMQASLARLPGLGADAAARETLLVGQAVIRQINFDPLLPPELGDQKAFLEMVDGMRAYNEAGQKCWRDYYASVTAG